MRNEHCRIKIVARKLKNVENKTQTVETWNMARNTEKREK